MSETFKTLIISEKIQTLVISKIPFHCTIACKIYITFAKKERKKESQNFKYQPQKIAEMSGAEMSMVRYGDELSGVKIYGSEIKRFCPENKRSPKKRSSPDLERFLVPKMAQDTGLRSSCPPTSRAYGPKCSAQKCRGSILTVIQSIECANEYFFFFFIL